MSSKLLKVTNKKTKRRYAIIASSFDEFCMKSKKKMEIDTGMEIVVFMEDGTEIDTESFPYLKEETVLVISLKNEGPFEEEKTEKIGEMVGESAASNSKNIQKDEQRNKNPVSIFRVGLQDFIDSKISPIAKYEAAKLMTFAVESFTTFVGDMKEMKDLEKDVISRGLIEIVEERFLGDRRAKENQNLSHEEKMRKVLTLSHPEIREIKKRIKEDSEITEENYPKYSAIAHDHFSSRIHQYIHRKRKIDYHHANEINGVFPGRYLAIRAMKILFCSVCSPTKGLHKKFFTPGRNLASHILEYQSLASSTNPRIPIQIPNPNPVKRHIRFHDDADDRKNDDCKLGKIKHKKRFTHGNFWWNTTDHGWKQSHERPHFTI